MSALQTTVLRAYVDYREKPPSLGRFLAKPRPSFLIVMLLFASSSVLGFLADQPVYAYGRLGIIIGVLLANVSHWRPFQELWPILSAVLDWDKVEAALGEHRRVE